MEKQMKDGAKECGKRFSEIVNLYGKALCDSSRRILFHALVFVHNSLIHCENQWRRSFSHPFCFWHQILVVVIVFFPKVPWLVRYSSRVSLCLVSSDNGSKSCCFHSMQVVVSFFCQLSVVVSVHTYLCKCVCLFAWVRLPQFTQIGWRIFCQWHNTVWKFIKAGSSETHLVRIVLCLFLCDEVH